MKYAGKPFVIMLGAILLSQTSWGDLLDISATVKECFLPNNESMASLAASSTTKTETEMNQVINASIVVSNGYQIQYPVHGIIEVNNGIISKIYTEAFQPVIDLSSIPTNSGPSTNLHYVKHIRNGNREFVMFDSPKFEGGMRKLIYEEVKQDQFAFSSPLSNWFNEYDRSRKLITMKNTVGTSIEDHGNFVVFKGPQPYGSTITMDKAENWLETSFGLRVEMNPTYKIPSYVNLYLKNNYSYECKFDSISVYTGDVNVFTIPDDKTINRFNTDTNEEIK